MKKLIFSLILFSLMLTSACAKTEGKKSDNPHGTEYG